MENEKESVKAFKRRGDLYKKSMRSESQDIVLPGTTPQDSSRNTSKPSLRSSLKELQLMLGPQTLKLCEALDDLNKAVDAEDLLNLMVAVKKLKTANAEIDGSCGRIETTLFELQDPAWSDCK